jgi:DNA-binding XRE family transcriptional regulator
MVKATMFNDNETAAADRLHVDVSRIGNSQVRNALRDTFNHLGYRYSEFDAFWPLFSNGQARRIPTNSLDPEAILDVRYSRSDHSLWIAFGDGLSGSIQPREIGFDDPRELSLETETVAPYHGGVQVLNRAGDVVDIDGGSLRAVLDGVFARNIVLQAESSSRRVGERLKGQRLKAGVTQVQLAERSGLDQAIISKLERGKHQPRWDTIQRYADGLGVAPENLLA